MRNLVLASACLVASTAVARADSLPSATPHVPTDGYVGIGVLVGSADDLVTGAASAEGGYRVGYGVWVHGMLAAGTADEFLGHGTGSFRQARLGLEAQGCTTSEMVCFVAGADAGVQQAHWTGTGLFGDSEETRGGPTRSVVIPRIGLDTGHDLRARVAFDLALDDSGVAGGDVTIGFTTRW